MPKFARLERHPSEAAARPRDSRKPLGNDTLISRSIARLLLSLVMLCGLTVSAQADPPIVYHSPADDGFPSNGVVEIPAGTSFSLFLYLDSGATPSAGSRCSAGTGDETCAWDIHLQAFDELTISEFDATAGVTYFSGETTLSLNGGDPWRGTLGPQRLGEITLTAGAEGGRLDVMPSTAVAADLSLETIPLSTLVTVPEPSLSLGLVLGGFLIVGLSRCRTIGRETGRGTAWGVVACAFVSSIILGAGQASAQVSTDCGDVISDGVIDISDLAEIRRFLAGDPAALDLQGTPALLARCDVSGDGICDIGDYARIRRYMIDLSGGMNETCPLVGSAYANAVLPPPSLDQASFISTDRASVFLSGTADPGDLVRVTGSYGNPSATAHANGRWGLEVPLYWDTTNNLSVFVDHGAGYVGSAISVDVVQTSSTGDSDFHANIVNALDGNPIAEATVTIGGISKSSNSLGRVNFSDLPEGRISIAIEKTGFVPEMATARTGAILSDPSRRTIGILPHAPAVTIGSGGGTITSPAGYQLEIPAGSLAADTPISFTELTSPLRPSWSGFPLVDIGPGTIVFDPPATLRIPAQLAPGQPVDFEQVEQATASATKRIGFANASGDIELPVHSTTGDGYVVDLGFPGETSQIGTEISSEVVTSPEFFEINCESEPIKKINFSLRQKFEFTRTSDDPVAIEAEEDPFLAFESDKLWGGEQIGEEPELNIAPGTAAIYTTTSEFVTFVTNPRITRFPSDSGIVQTEILGQLRFTLEIPQSIDLVRTVPADSTMCPPLKGADWGDPHLTRFDNSGRNLFTFRGRGRYNFQASGEFVLFESTQDDMVVQARYEPYGPNANVTVTTALGISVDGDGVSVTRAGASLAVHINGLLTPLLVDVPFALPGGGQLERKTRAGNLDELNILWSDGSSLLILMKDRLVDYLNVYPVLAGERFAEVQGLLGNANGILTDDWRLRDGSEVDSSELYTTYADSWRISAAESLFYYEPAENTATYNGSPPDPDYTLDDLDPVDRAAAEAVCIAAGITEDPLFSDCALDVAILGGASEGDALETLNQVPPVGEYFALSGQANIFGAGLGSPPDLGGGGGVGLSPVELAIPAGTNRAVRVLDRAGAVSFGATGEALPPAGLSVPETNWGDWAGLSGPRTERLGIALGVFLDDSAPGVPPGAFDCGDGSSASMAPALGQIFCLGSGMSTVGDSQTVLVPDPATRLFVGFAERLSSLLVEAEVHHLGDNVSTTGLFALDPDPEGAVWTSDPFGAPVATTPSRALIRVDLVNTNFSSNAIRVNGQFAGNVPVTGSSSSVWTNDLEVEIDPALLQLSNNTIELTAVASGSNLDDYLFRNLRLDLTPAFDQLPAPNDSEGHHLGDQSLSGGLYAQYPDPEGLLWQSQSFDAPGAGTAVAARLLVEIAHTDYTNNQVFLNGKLAGSLPLRATDATWSTPQAIEFDPAFLRTTNNRLTIRSGQSGSDYDDILIRNPRIELAPEISIPPGGYDDNTGVDEFIIDLGG